MLTTLLVLMALCFLSHVIMLFTSFGGGGVKKTRYFLSHLTLWLTGAFGYLIAVLYAGKGESSIIDIFDTPFKQVLLIVVAFALSLIAHSIVRLFVLPQHKRA
ncbi:hypothetical protein [Paraflavitalea pollutisoli]|uniref:hypothetical protein n=1 Tax=Paraflavitalea pollutisoli TaxID=3034143 RepID=UPI0023EB41D8|nr:hypothetical protein [Paraflavitalea sp. H1-2-19X]